MHHVFNNDYSTQTILDMDNKLFIDVVLYTIIIIFACTAILALLSIPNWIKIEEWYKKKLFTALIIEVIAAVLATYTIVLNNKKGDSSTSETTEIVTPNENPVPFYTANDSTKHTKRPNFGNFKLAGFSLDSIGDASNHAEIKWEKIKNGKWTEIRKYGRPNTPAITGCPFFIIVKDTLDSISKKTITVYQIYKEGNSQPIVCSDKDGGNNWGINTNKNRILHCLDYVDNQSTCYAIFYIYDADVDHKKEKFINFSQIVIEPQRSIVRSSLASNRRSS